MTTIRFVLSLFSGLAFAVTIVFLTLVSVLAYAFITETGVLVPGVLRAWITTENDLPALNFEPNGIGLLGAIGIVMAVFVGSATVRRRQIT